MKYLPNEQTISKILLVLSHIQARTEQGTLFIIGLLWIQQFSGLPQYLLKDPSQQCYHLDGNFWTYIITFLYANSGKIEIPELPPIEPPYCEEDIALMEVANDSTVFYQTLSVSTIHTCSYMYNTFQKYA